MSDDIVERLRQYGHNMNIVPFRICDEAADEIERLRGRGVFGDDGVPRLLIPQTRAEIIEECAKVIDDEDGYYSWAGEYRNIRLLQDHSKELAAAVRALAAQKEKTHEPG